ncbi:thiamine diphosphate-binding protein [Lactarius pseudohatsudake]|nr:thiamine diphosphate-binding protein [Lactarius pseudohatsudake]
MKALIDRSVDHGVKHVTIGMPHRGRLNVLANVIRKPIEAILNEFSGVVDSDAFQPGDVKYHLGANYVRPTPSGKKVSLSLVANPSRLEACDPVVLGKTRAIQFLENDEVGHSTAMGVLLHGDAAFAGQGVVYETTGFHNLPCYGTVKLYGGYVLRDRIESVAHLDAPNKHRQTLQTRRLGLRPFFKTIRVCAVVGYVTVEAGETGLRAALVRKTSAKPGVFGD